MHVQRADDRPGHYNIVGTDSASSDTSNTVSFTVIPLIQVTPTQGPVGSIYQVTGSGFTDSSSATLTFGGTLQTPSSCSAGTFTGVTITTTASGGFVCTFPVHSESAGNYAIIGKDSSSGLSSATVMFQVTALAVSISESSGPIGTPVTVSGTGYTPSSTVTLVLDSVSITSCTSGSLSVSGTGAFSCSFDIPSGTSGTTVTATDVNGGVAKTKFSVTSITIKASPTQGPVGSMETVTGKGFPAPTGGSVTLTFGGDTIASCSSGSLALTATGTFSCTFAVPNLSAGTQTVTATDTGGQAASTTYKITTPTIKVSPTKGAPGTSITVTGSGFTVDSTVTLVFDGLSITSCTSGSLSTSATGAWSCTFDVPSVSPGTVTITATDVATGAVANTTFKVT